MRYDCRTAGAAATLAAVLVAAGLSFAGDHKGPVQPAPQQFAQATVTDTASRATGDNPATTVIEKEDVQAILGRQVLSSTGEDMGRVIDIVVDRSGQVRAAV